MVWPKIPYIYLYGEYTVLLLRGLTKEMPKNAQFCIQKAGTYSHFIQSRPYSRLVQWVIWYEEFVVKNGLYATANQAHAPKLASFKFYIYGQIHIMQNVELANLGAYKPKSI